MRGKPILFKTTVARKRDPFVPPKGNVCLVNQLPLELLSRIFELAPVHDPIRWFPEYQVNASHVCRHWRNVALSTPFFWDEIMVDRCSRPPYSHVAAQLERTKNIPVDLFIADWCMDGSNKHAENDLQADFTILFSMLLSHVRRWGVVYLWTRRFDGMFAFLNGIADDSISTPATLSMFHISYDNRVPDDNSSSYPNMSQHLAHFLGSAPRLSALSLMGVSVDWTHPWVTSVSNLTELSLSFFAEYERPSWAQFSAILRSASALGSLSIVGSGPSGDPMQWFIMPTPGSLPGLNDPIQLPQLNKLKLSHCSQAHAIGLLRKLYLPALYHLGLNLSEVDDYTDLVHELAGPATSPSHRSTTDGPPSLLSQLDRLEIKGLQCPDECVDILYSELQSATFLDLSMESVPKRFFFALCTRSTLAGRRGIWLPELQTLRIEAVSELGNAARVLVNARKAMGAPLERLIVALEPSASVDKRDIEWLKKNVECVLIE